ncbi:WD40 repeat domain-containing protein [Kitasatospora sp. NPDC051853]|uniref:WD40 repeat domain-containing protein n=1 Tax=Kitasatospora sp. NPDC051853 TaxID=3364058 RepID=UPI0037AA9624
MTGDHAQVVNEQHFHLPPEASADQAKDAKLPPQRSAQRADGNRSATEESNEAPDAGRKNSGTGAVVLVVLLIIGSIVYNLDRTTPDGAVPASTAVLDDLESAEAVAFGPDGTNLTVSGHTGITRLWDTTTLKATPVIPDPVSGSARGVLLSNDGRVLATAGAEKVRLTEVATGRTLATITAAGFLQSISAMAFSRDARTLVTVAAGDRIRGWEVATGNPSFAIGRNVHASAIAFSPDGTSVATVGTEGEDGAVRLWNIATGATVTGLALREDNYGTSFSATAFSPDGLTLAVAAGRRVRFVDTRMGRLTDSSLTGHGADITDLAFSPDGKTLATASADRTARLWDLTGGKTFATLTDHQEPVLDLAFSPDGRRLATAGADRTARLWTVPCFSPDLLVTASPPSGRPSTTAGPTPTPCPPVPTHRIDP